MNAAAPLMRDRFRGFLPVVVDVETGGFDWNRHALLEIAAIPVELDDAGGFVPGEVACAHLQPAPGTEIDPSSEDPLEDCRFSYFGRHFGNLQHKVVGLPFSFTAPVPNARST